MSVTGHLAPAPGLGAAWSTAQRLVRPGALGLAVGIIAWELAARSIQVIYMPPPTEVTGRLVDLVVGGEILSALGSSLTNLAFGLAISIVAGISLGLLTGSSRRAALALDPYVNALLTAPTLVFAPIFFTIWGVGSQSAVALIVAYSVFVIIVNTSAAARAASTDLLEMAESFDASRVNVFRQVTLPAATPLILTGMRLAVARGVKGMINAEMFIAISGLGKLIEDAQSALDASTVIAVLAVVIIVAMILLWFVDQIDRRLTVWLPPTARSG